MPPNPYLDAIYKHNAAYKHVIKDTPTPLHDLEDLVSTLPPPIRVISMNAGYLNTGVGDDKTPNVGENVVVEGVEAEAEEDPYYLPEYFDLSQALEGEGREEVVKEEAKPEFNPPLGCYADVTDGLHLGYVWLPPSFPVPMPVEEKLQGSTSCPGFGKRKRDGAPETPRKQKKTVTFTPETRG